MMHRATTLTVAVALLFLAIGGASARSLLAATPIKTLIVFGDSLSDAGLPNGLWKYTNSTVPKESLGYVKGRFTNGKVWNEMVAEASGLTLINFAVGGSTANPLPGKMTLDMQIANFNAYMMGRILKAPVGVVFVIGGNDLSALIESNTTFLTSATNQTKGLMEGVHKAVQRHAEALLATNPPLGIKALVVANLAPAEVTPLALNVRPTVARLAPPLAKIINQGIAASVKVLLWDVQAALKAAVAKPSIAGVKNVKDACLVASPPSSTNPNAKLVSTCAKPDDYFFWDHQHPTTAIHRYMATKFTDLLKEAGLLN